MNCWDGALSQRIEVIHPSRYKEVYEREATWRCVRCHQVKAIRKSDRQALATQCLACITLDLAHIVLLASKHSKNSILDCLHFGLSIRQRLYLDRFDRS